MKGRITPIALACGAIILVAAAVFLLRPGDQGKDETRGNVGEPPEAPAWTAEGQKQPLPDYGSANATVKTVSENATEDATTEAATEDTAAVDEMTPPRVVQEDDMVTVLFLDVMAETLVEGFVPARMSDSGNPETTLGFRKLNMRFGRSLKGFDTDTANINMARDAVLSYLLAPGVAKSIFNDYQPVFVDKVEETARNASLEDADGTEYMLSEAEVSDLFLVYADAFDMTGRAVRAAAEPSVAQTVERYIRAARAAERANAAFRTAMADYDTDSGEVSAAGSRLKGAIKERQRIRKIVLKELRDECPECDSEELFYIAMWSYRRTLESDNTQEFMNTAADCLERLSGSFKDRATRILEE
ncbi:hypothetical protein [Desulfovibrio oxyclinae]|uniref:hypothetical protein n=1 Tax=Desulfovibrio oxyclinae TaxID=63560 RepID=UPI0003720B60|nr:hypothetical protein [Desulfovibrio oxyclinae]